TPTDARHTSIKFHTSHLGERDRPSRVCITLCDTVSGMAQAISVRLDEEALTALSQLEATGMSRSHAIRRALVDAAARLSDKTTLAAEVAALEVDDEDRAEMLAVAEMMESLRAQG
ncbi:MAG: ribbon-helix-helix protein, CopG family, partial [Actinomycetota bacterium]